MTGYFYALLATSVCGTLCIMLCGGGFEKYIKYIAALISVSVMILPLRHINKSDFAIDSNLQSTLDKNMLEKTAEEIAAEKTESYISQEVLAKFGINPTDISISIDWEREDPTVTSITVYIPKNSEKATKIQGYLTTLLGGEVKVIEN